MSIPDNQHLLSRGSRQNTVPSRVSPILNPSWNRVRTENKVRHSISVLKNIISCNFRPKNICTVLIYIYVSPGYWVDGYSCLILCTTHLERKEIPPPGTF